MRKIILLSLFLLSFTVLAQDSPEVISAANMHRLQSVAQIDFTDIDAEFDTGMFWMNDTGSLIVWATSNGLPVFLSNLQDLSPLPDNDNPTLTSQIAYAFRGDSAFGLYQIDNVTYIQGTEIELESIPLNLWSVDDKLFVESINEEGLPVFWEYTIIPHTARVQENPIGLHSISLGSDDVVRIGRIPLPYLVSSSLDGRVRLWSFYCVICTHSIIYEVDNGTGQPAVFGAINIIPDSWPTHLVWRDNANKSLYLLNFETGENRLIDELNGDYAQWFFLSPDASVILAVNLGFEPNIVAWDVATGERTVLGEYRQCNRPQPDMARLSADGTTLVIACDTGLDIWRIVD